MHYIFGYKCGVSISESLAITYILMNLPLLCFVSYSETDVFIVKIFCFQEKRTLEIRNNRILRILKIYFIVAICLAYF